MKKRLKQNFLFMLLITFLLSFIIPIYGEAKTSIYSSKENELILNEGDNYGIYPNTWYEDNFQDPISKKKLNLLIQNVQTKLDQIGLPKNTDFKPVLVKNNVKRETVLIKLYNVLQNYQLPKILQQNESDPITYFQNQNIIPKSKKKLDKDSKCTIEQACVWAVQLIENTYHAADAGSKGLLWKAQKGKNTVYLLGSIHVGDTNLYPFHQELKDIFEKSEALYVEVNLLDTSGSLYLMRNALYTDGTTLKDHVSEDVYKKTIEALKKYHFIPVEIYTYYKPWFLASLFENISLTDSYTLTEASNSANLGIDMYFTKKAALTKKPIVELEGIPFQTDLFNSLSNNYQEEYLSSAVDSILNPETLKEDKELLQLWQQQWKNRDFDGFRASYQLTSEEENDEFSAMLLGDRDKAMAQKIGKLLEQEGEHTYFVVIGAAHLALENMTIDQLKQNGYKVKQVN